MHVRHQHVLVFGAHRPFGHRIVEALLALGAHVVAAAPLRTELESLRAELRQHERLHVAECSDTDAEGPRLLMEATRRRGALDAIVHVGGDPESVAAEIGALTQALAALVPGGAPRVIFARRHDAGASDDEDLAPPPRTRDFPAALLYDPEDPSPALHHLLMLLSSPLAS